MKIGNPVFFSRWGASRDDTPARHIGRSYGLAVGAAVVAFVPSPVQSLRRTPSPALILAHAAFEGSSPTSSPERPRRTSHRVWSCRACSVPSRCPRAS